MDSPIRLSLLVLVLVLAACTSNPPQPTPEDQAGQTVFVVRHAEAWKNVDHAPDMSPDQLDTLTSRGQEQAQALGRRLTGRGVGLVLYSPTGRTRETATRIAEALGVEAREAPGLAPLKAGTTPGGDLVSWSWREEQWRSGEDPRPVSGESLEDGVRRALDLIAQSRGEGALVLVTHGDVAAGLLGHAAGTPLPQRWARHEQQGGSVADLQVTGGEWRLGEQWGP